MRKVSTQWAPLEGPRDRSLLGAQARWILTVALVTVVSALVLSWALHDPVYRSNVHVVVNPALTPSGAALATNMETERQVAISGTVLSAAATQAGVPPDQLRDGLSVSVPPETTVLEFDYQDRTAATAQRRAQALADAYITYRGRQAALLTPATVPQSPTRPAYVVNGAAALVLGLLLGLGTAMLRDRRDDSVRGPQDLARRADVPVLVTVPATPAADGGRGLVVLEQPRSSAAEAYRQLRTKLCRMARDRQGVASMTLVAGAAEDDGACDVAANLAVELAVAGSRVLLVEADLRTDGTAGPAYGTSEVGLADVLAGDIPLVEAMAVGPTDRLMRLAAGDGGHLPPGRLLDERAIDRLLGQVPDDVQHVVFHASPVLRAAATSTVAERADLVVLAALIGRTAGRDVRAAVAELRGGGAVLAGCVLMPHQTEREPLRERSLETDAPTDDRTPAPHGRGAHRSPGQPDADLVSASDI
jgi:succinoglycan biosynthesis transport protein ExoP